MTDKQVQLFRVCDDYDGGEEDFDTLEEAIKYAEELVKAYREDAAVDGWFGGSGISVCRVVRRWSLMPVAGPDGEMHDKNGDEYYDMVEEDLPPVLTLEMGGARE